MRRVARMKELDEQEVADLFIVVKKVSKFIEAFHNTTSTTVAVQGRGDFVNLVLPDCHVMFQMAPRQVKRYLMSMFM